MPDEDFEQVKGDLFDALLQRSFEVHTVEEEKAGLHFEPPLEGDVEALPLFDEDDRDILMHRDAHFASSFPIMIEYYEKEGKGAVLDVSVDRIRALELLQNKLGKDIAPFVLQGSDAEKIARSRSLYKALRKQYEEALSPLMKVCADLILSEEEPKIEEFLPFGKTSGACLLQLIKTEELYDPLFPGYGMAPLLACRVLGKLQAKDAIPTLFSLIDGVDFDMESEVIATLVAIGDEAKKFLLKALVLKPFGRDNERACVALSAFLPDNQIKEAARTLLASKDVQEKKTLVRYLQNLYQDV
jgi:hypothetical protein